MAVYVPPTGVATLELFDTLAQNVVASYTEAESRVLRELQRRLDRGLTAVDPEQRLRRMAAGLREAREAFQAAAAGADPNLGLDAIATAIQEGQAAAAAQLAGFSHLPKVNPLTATQLSASVQVALDLQSRLTDVRQRILRFPEDEYQRLIAGQVPQVLLGAQTSLQAQREAVARWLSQGIPGFVDARGRNWAVGSYVEMAVRTATHRAYTDAGVQRMTAARVNLVRVIVGGSACETCASHIGRVYSTDGTTGTVTVQSATDGRPIQVTVDGTLDAARGSGHFMGPNCRCSVVAWLPGMPIPVGATTYDPDLEAARERQRALERRLRAMKREQGMSPSEARQAELRGRIRRTEADLRKHLADWPDLTRKRNREQPGFSHGRPGDSTGPARPGPVRPTPGQPGPAAPPPPTTPPPAPPTATPTAPPAAAAAQNPAGAAAGALDAAGREAARVAARVGVQDRIRSAATIQDAEQELRAVYPATNLNLAKAGQDEGLTKAALVALADMAERFPGVLGHLRTIQVAPLRKGTMAQVRYRYEMRDVRAKNGGVKRAKVIIDQSMEVDPLMVQDAAKLWDTPGIRGGGHFHEVPGGAAGLTRATIVHELGHAIDNALQGELKKEWQAIKGRARRTFGNQQNADNRDAFDQWMLQNVSGYGRTTDDEAVAELLSDAILNGEHAHAPALELLAWLDRRWAKGV